MANKEVELYDNIIKMIRHNHLDLSIETIIKELLMLGLKFPDITADYLFKHYALDFRTINDNTNNIESEDTIKLDE